ncbi:MAG: protein-L-isoaspartate O-methyltransferase [Rhizobiaceae bacterium]|nr:protein-L-isoaspartate O-methyltransferase [Rhizobiaceae bacterium]
MHRSDIESLQLQVLTSFHEKFPSIQLSGKVKEVFLSTPRHNYVRKIISEHDAETIDITEQNISNYLNIIYKDTYLPIKLSRNGDIVSSISQPSLVLLMLEMAELKFGESVLEIGSASGWNAAMLSKLVGTSGSVDTIEIDPDLAQQAKQNLRDNDREEVVVHCADGARGIKGKHYDAIIYTVGIYDVPSEIYEQLSEGGILILVLKNHGGGDTLYKLRRTSSGFVSEEALQCGFVQIQGDMRLPEFQPIIVSQAPELKSLWDSLEGASFWFGEQNSKLFFWRSMAFRAFLSVSDPYFSIFSTSKDIVEPSSEQVAFGLYNADEKSLAVFQNEKIQWSGSKWAKDRIYKRLNEWVMAGMPPLSAFGLECRLRAHIRKLNEQEHIILRDETCFYYTNFPKFRE